MKPEIKIGDYVHYLLVVPEGGKRCGPEKVVEIKREAGRITHVKLADSPCWVPIEYIFV